MVQKKMMEPPLQAVRAAPYTLKTGILLFLPVNEKKNLIAKILTALLSPARHSRFLLVFHDQTES